MKITVIGAGYVGLVSAACFSDFGYDVTCVDREAAKVDSLKELQAKTAAELDALLPSILDRAFKGEL